MVHVLPLNDEAPHRHGTDCWCDPRVEWADTDGLVYPRGPLVVHNSADCREAVEPLLAGESIAPDKGWEAYED